MKDADRKPSELLACARDHITKVGLNKGAYFLGGEARDDVPCCTYGALILCSASGPHLSEDHYQFAEHSMASSYLVRARKTQLSSLVYGGVNSIITYNDNPGTKLEDIVALFDKAISFAVEEGR